jgi:formylglycine-generating enzyme required for sulfatase activity
MVEIPATDLELQMQMKGRECGDYDSVPKHCTVAETVTCNRVPTAFYLRRVTLDRFAIDETCVTNAEFAVFLKITAYHPAQRENFLRHWGGAHPPRHLMDHPVVYVDLDDARAYAKWAGKRLPTEEEWQYAAQGTDARKFPWGEQFDAARCNGDRGATMPVKAFPNGRSAFGCYDMCGNVWQWTESERTDGRTRFCVIRGGSWFKAEGSEWYVEGGLQPVDLAAKFLMSWPGLDRCSTIGFRCVVDLKA